MLTNPVFGEFVLSQGFSSRMETLFRNNLNDFLMTGFISKICLLFVYLRAAFLLLYCRALDRVHMSDNLALVIKGVIGYSGVFGI